MTTRFLWLLIAFLLVALLAVGGVSIVLATTRPVPQPYQQTPVMQGTPALGVTQIAIRNNAYRPDVIEVTVGAAVTWTNEDSVIHSVVLPHVITSQNNILDSGSLTTGQSFTYTFTIVGTFQYDCAQHPDMIGVVIVTPEP